MQMEREKRNWNGNRSYSEFCCDYDEYGVDQDDNRRNLYPTNAMSSSSTLLPVSSPSSPPSGIGYIEHPVSKLDTLAGVAIKYGVEVADIKKLNGLVTDLQMFALKSLQIPLPGRHPPSPCLSNGSTPGQSSCDRISTQSMHRDLFESFQSLRLNSSQRQVSSAMTSLQGYYGLKSSKTEGFEMLTNRKGPGNYLEDKLLPQTSNPNLRCHRKSKSMVNGFFDENGMADITPVPVVEAKEGDSDKWSEKLVRRRQKSEADFSRAPKMLLENNSVSSGFSPITGKRLAPRPKAAARTSSLAPDIDTGGCGLNPLPVSFVDSYVADGFFGVRKSSSTSSLQDQESSGSASIWLTSKWNLKPDLQAFSTAAMGKPIFDGLPKPTTGRRSKAAID